MNAIRSIPTLSLACLLLAGCPDKKPAVKDRAWNLVLDQVQPDGTVTVDTARAAFVLAIGPLPGVATPPGVIAPIEDGTIAVHWILAHYDELTADQRVAVDHFLAPASPKADDPTHMKFAALVDAASKTIAMKTGIAQLSIDTVINAPELVPAGQTALAYIVAEDAFGKRHGPFVSCAAHFNPDVVNAPDWQVAEAIPHEVFHCYEARLAPDLDRFHLVPAWITEGAAEWAGATLSGHAFTPADKDGTPSGSWIRCLKQPYRPLYTLTYDALCFYAEMDATAHSPWTNVDAIMAGFFVGDNEGAVNGAIGGNQYFLKSWASSVVRDSRLGPEWDLTGPGITNDRATVTPVDVGNGGVANDLLPAVSSNDYLLRPSAEVLLLRTPRWSSLRSLKGNGTDTPFGDWCVHAPSCDCPTGSARAGQHLPSLPADDYYMSVSGGLRGSDWFAGGMTLDDYCNSDRVEKCVQGSWQMQTAGPLPTQIQCTEPTPIGTVLTFANNGDAVEDFSSSSTITCTSAGMTVMTTLGGRDTAKVTADHGYMLVSNIDNSAVTVNSMLNGKDLGMGLSSAFRGKTGMNPTLSYTCTGNILLIQADTGVLYTLFKQ